MPDGTKPGVMKAAFEQGRKFGMRYFEVYTPDIMDTTLHSLFAEYAAVLARTTQPTHAASDAADAVPPGALLAQNYPNPFNPSTTITFTLPERAMVRLTVHDAAGRTVAVAVSEELGAGEHSRSWNADACASGMYYYRLEAGAYRATKKMTLLR